MNRWPLALKGACLLISLVCFAPVAIAQANSSVNFVATNSIFSYPTLNTPPRAADLNGDGRLDLVSGGIGRVVGANQ